MYRLGHRPHHRYLIGGAVVFAVASLVTVGAVLSNVLLQAHTTLHQVPPIIRTVLGDTTALQHIDQGTFVLDIPADWHAVAPPHVRYNVYSWAGTTGTGASERLDVYIDSVPLDLAINKLLPIEANGDHLTVIGQISDNCTNFTTPSPAAAPSGTSPSKWDGIDFLCDTGNYERDVIATGSDEGMNITTLSGAVHGSHRVLLVYTDNNINPDYSRFISITQSFRLT